MLRSKMKGGLFRGLWRLLAMVIVAGTVSVLPAAAQTNDRVTGQIEWGLWIDRDGCMHWWADGGSEGFMVPRRNAKTGGPVCMKIRNCLIESTDDLFDGSNLTADGRARLRSFFGSTKADGFGIYAHSDNTGGRRANEDLTDAQATEVADVARSMGLWVEQEAGVGQTRPVASNKTKAGRAENRRLVIACYKW